MRKPPHPEAESKSKEREESNMMNMDVSLNNILRNHQEQPASPRGHMNPEQNMHNAIMNEP